PAREFLVAQAQGDARAALNTLETAARHARHRPAPAAALPLFEAAAPQRRLHPRALDLPLLEEAAQQRALRYDKAGEEHYNIISAFIKSLRGGDPDAAPY